MVREHIAWMARWCRQVILTGTRLSFFARHTMASTLDVTIGYAHRDLAPPPAQSAT